MCLNELKLDLHNCSPQDTTIALYLVMALVLISLLFFFFTQHGITRSSPRVPLYCIVINQINKILEGGLKSLPESKKHPPYGGLSPLLPVCPLLGIKPNG